jgi:hypothetical protein
LAPANIYDRDFYQLLKGPASEIWKLAETLNVIFLNIKDIPMKVRHRQSQVMLQSRQETKSED